MNELVSFDGVRLSYERHDPSGASKAVPVLLLHGYASSSYVNWVRPGVVELLVRVGRTAVAVDARGHGESDKPHDPAAYVDEAMVGDAAALVDELRVPTVDVVGYSMGAGAALRLAATDHRVRSVVAGGAGPRMLRPSTDTGVIADAMEADDPATITNPTARGFRRFADLTGADRTALAAAKRAGLPRVDAELAAAIVVPVLVLAGDDDALVGDPAELAAALPRARAEVVGGSHLNVVNNPAFGRAIVQFLQRVDDGLA